VFTTPVKLIIPYPDRKKVDNLHIYLYKAGEWVRACDNKGQVLPDGEAWMVPGSRVNHNDRSPPTIQITLYHFSGVHVRSEAAAPDPLPHVTLDNSNRAEEKAGCFISTAFVPLHPNSSSEAPSGYGHSRLPRIRCTTLYAAIISLLILMARKGAQFFRLRQAKRRCPDAAVLFPRLHRYEKAMDDLFRRALPFSPFVEPGDRDGHLFIDVSGTGCADPVIWSFAPTTYQVNPGERFSIFWNTDCADAVFFKFGANAEIQVPPDGSYIDAQIYGNTTFRLRLRKDDWGDAFASFVVTIK